MIGKKLRSVLIVAVFSGIAAVLSLVKFGGAASIALDSFPGYFVAGFFSPYLGGAVALIGHVLSAAVGGFPLGEAHLLVATMQFFWAFTFGIIPRYFNNVWFFIVSAPVAIVLNGYVGPILIGLVFPHLAPIVKSLIPILMLASAINVILATAAVVIIRKFKMI